MIICIFTTLYNCYVLQEIIVYIIIYFYYNKTANNLIILNIIIAIRVSSQCIYYHPRRTATTKISVCLLYHSQIVSNIIMMHGRNWYASESASSLQKISWNNGEKIWQMIKLVDFFCTNLNYCFSIYLYSLTLFFSPLKTLD